MVLPGILGAPGRSAGAVACVLIQVAFFLLGLSCSFLPAFQVWGKSCTGFLSDVLLCAMVVGSGWAATEESVFFSIYCYLSRTFPS